MATKKETTQADEPKIQADESPAEELTAEETIAQWPSSVPAVPEFNKALAGYDRNIKELEGRVVREKQLRQAFYAKFAPVYKEPTLQELNAAAAVTNATEDARRSRLWDELARLSSTMNVKPRAVRAPLAPLKGD